MTAPAAPPAVIPDLTAAALDELAEEGAGVLARSVALYRERLEADGVPLTAFNARIA